MMVEETEAPEQKHIEKTTKKEIKKKPISKVKLGLLVGGLIIGILIGLILSNSGITGAVVGGSTMSSDDAASKAITYINSNILRGQGQAILGEVSEEAGLYKVQITVNGQAIDSYITKDGSLLFPQSFNLDAPVQAAPQQQAPAQQEVPTSDKPVVEAFVFSYCPFGLQFQKAMIPIYDLLKDTVDIELIAIGAMHGEYEKVESLREICIEKEYGKDKLWDYLKVFMDKTELGQCGGSEACINPIVDGILTDLKLDKIKINSCMASEGIERYNSQNARARELGISGSPNFVVNDVSVPVGRNPEAIKEVICDSFNEAPEECSQTLSSEGASSGFGYSTSGTASSATC